MSLQSLYPFAGNHAIQSAMFAVEWPTPLLDSDLLKLRTVVGSLRTDFPALQEQKLFTVNVTPGQQTPDVKAEELGGFVLSRQSSLLTGVARSLTLNRTSCAINISDYTRWDKAKSDVQRYLNLLLPAIDRGLNVLGLQYGDVFLWRDKPEKLPISEVFQKGSKYLPSNVFTVPNLWHSHHGYFDTENLPAGCRQLDNVNVSRAESEGGHLVQILTSHRIDFAELLWDKNADASILDLLERMHARNKDILRDLLSPEVQELIKLNKAVEAKND